MGLPQWGRMAPNLRPKEASHSSVKASSSGNTTVITVSSSTHRIIIHHAIIGNGYAGDQEIYLKWSGSSTKYYYQLYTEGQKVVLNPIGAELAGPHGNNLQVNVQTDGDVYVSVTYSEVDDGD